MPTRTELSRTPLSPGLRRSSSEVASNQFSRSSWDPKLGTPIYVIEQPEKSAGRPEFKLWEVRPADQIDAGLFSGSRLLLTHPGRIGSFALGNFSIDEKEIKTQIFYALDEQGRLWSKRLDEAGPLKQIPGEYVLLEKSAEGQVHAVTQNHDLVAINSSTGETICISKRALGLETNERIVALQRDGEIGNLLIATDRNQLLHWNVKSKSLIDRYDLTTLLGREFRPLENFALTSGAIWAMDSSQHTLVRYDFELKKINSVSLSSLYKDAQDGAKIEFMGVDNEMLYARIGAHAIEFSTPKLGSRLNVKLLAPDFFGTKIREFGVESGLYTTLSILQPREADRSGRTRKDLQTRQNVDRDFREEPSSSDSRPPVAVDDFTSPMSYEQIQKSFKYHNAITIPSIRSTADAFKRIAEIFEKHGHKSRISSPCQDLFSKKQP